MALKALMSRRSRRWTPVSNSPLLGSGFLRAVEPPAMRLDVTESTDAETGELVLIDR